MFHVKHHTHITTYTHITRRDAHHQHTSALSYQRRDRRQVHTHQHTSRTTSLQTTSTSLLDSGQLPASASVTSRTTPI